MNDSRLSPGGSWPVLGPVLLQLLLDLRHRIARLTRRSLADAAGAADGLLVHRRLAGGVGFEDADGVGGVGGEEVGADLLGQAVGALLDTAAAHDLHVGAAVDLAEVV